MTPLQLSTNWLLRVSFTFLTTPAVRKTTVELQNYYVDKEWQTVLPHLTPTVHSCHEQGILIRMPAST